MKNTNKELLFYHLLQPTAQRLGLSSINLPIYKQIRLPKKFNYGLAIAITFLFMGSIFVFVTFFSVHDKKTTI
jgi:hypothetical protein